MRLCLLLLFALTGGVRADTLSVAPRAATLAVTWHGANLAELKLAADADVSRYALRPATNQRLSLHDGQLQALHGDAFRLARPFELQLRGQRVRIDAARLAISRGDAFEFALVDRDDRVWLNFDHGHPQRRSGGAAAEWRHFDVRIGPALAQQIGDAALVGSPLASARIDMQLAASAKATQSCVAPNFPNTGNYVIDVALTAIDTADATCNGACTGFGAPNAQVKMTPSARLQGVGTADVPWYEKFLSSPHSYPYAGNDQHPYLVWAVYRINALGQIEQLARSGVKHAFYSINQFPNGANNCGCGAASVLWSGCTDTYGWSTNDSALYLAPRHEIIPFRGQWGRCGSLRDADCNASDDGPLIPNFEFRAVVPETALVPSLNPGAQWFVEAWYVVRDDSVLANSLGHRRIVPAWSQAPTSKWMLNFYQTLGDPLFPFVSGPVFDQWLAPGTTTATTMSRDLATADGRLRLSVKVASLPGGQYRYDYALMNFDHTRAQTSGSEPNLQVLANDGPIAFVLPMSPQVALSSDQHDGDLDAANDWIAGRSGATWRFDAPSGTSMPWGALFRFSLTTNLPPTSGAALITPGGSGSPANLSVDTLLPDSSQLLFGDGFE